MRRLLLLCLLSLTPLLGHAAHAIALDDPGLRYDGAWFIDKQAERVRFDRHRLDLLQHPEAGISKVTLPAALTQVGVRIRLRTASPYIGLRFEPRSEGMQQGLRYGFAVYANGVRQAIYEQLAFTVQAPAGQQGEVEYEVLLPSLQAVDLVGLALDDGYKLAKPAADTRPVYVAIGDSITHGTGQQSASFLNYPHQLAQAMGWQLVNLGVAGAHIGWPLAEELAGRQADYITVALGFNDWFWGSKPLADRKAAYGKLLDTLRRHQPQARIFAITPIASSETIPRNGGGFTLDELRAAIREQVALRQQAGDTRLYLIVGEAISDTSMVGDRVHLSIDGAARYAKNLERTLRPLLGMP